MKEKLIRFLLRLLGHKAKREIIISVRTDTSQALQELKELEKQLAKIAHLQNQVK